MNNKPLPNQRESKENKDRDFTPAHVGLGAAAGAAAFATIEAIVEGADAQAAGGEPLILNPEIIEETSDIIEPEAIIDTEASSTDIVQPEPVNMDPRDFGMPVFHPISEFPDMPVTPVEPTPEEEDEPIEPEPDDDNDDIPEAILAEDLIDPDDVEEDAIYNFYELGTTVGDDGDEIPYARFTDDDGTDLIAYDYDNDGRMDEIRTSDNGSYIVTDSDGNIVNMAERIFVDDVEEALHRNDGYLAAHHLNTGGDMDYAMADNETPLEYIDEIDMPDTSFDNDIDFS